MLSKFSCLLNVARARERAAFRYVQGSGLEAFVTAKEPSLFLVLSSTSILANGFRMRSTVGELCSIRLEVCMRESGPEIESTALVQCIGKAVWNGTEDIGSTTSPMVSGSMSGTEAPQAQKTQEQRWCAAIDMWG